MKTRKRVLYRGQVQGVGFRATCTSIARRHEVAGYVRNLADGRVELVAEGSPPEVGAFLEEVARHMGGYIRETTSSDEPAQELTGFRVER